MDSDTIRFAAALHNLGGEGSKKNSQAAKLAGLEWNRVECFRAARSVSVQRLLREARDIKRGKRPPLTEREIDEKIDDLIRCPDALTVARGIELREKRKTNTGGGMSFDNLTPLDEVMVLVLASCRYGQCRPETWPLFWAELLLPRDGWSAGRLLRLISRIWSGRSTEPDSNARNSSGRPNARCRRTSDQCCG